MIKEKRKTENSVSKKQGKNRTQKVSLCLIPSKQLVTNHKSNPFCQNLNIKFKTTKSSPEKAIINQENYNDSSKNNTKKLQNEENKDIDKISGDFMKQKLIKKQNETKTKINRLNFTNPKFLNNNQTNPPIHSARYPHNNHKVLAQHRLLSPFNDNSNNNNSNNSNINSSLGNNYHKQTNSIQAQSEISNKVNFINNSNSKQKNKISQTTPVTNQNSRKASKEKIFSNNISNNINFTHYSNLNDKETKHEGKKIFNNKKNSILTNITRNSEKKRKNIGNNLITSINSTKSNYSSRDKLLLLHPSPSLNIKSLLYSSVYFAKPHLTSGNSPNRNKFDINHKNKSHSKQNPSSNITNSQSSINDKSKHNNSQIKKEAKQDIKSVIYSLKNKDITKSNVSANSKGVILYGKVNNSTLNKVSVISKSTSHSIGKSAITRKLSSYSTNKRKPSKNSNQTGNNKKVLIPINNKQNSKENKSVNIKRVANSKPTSSKRNNDFVGNNNEPSCVFNNPSTSSMKSMLIKEGTYYYLESEKVSNYIKMYYKKYDSYPPTTLSFYKFGRLIGRGAFGKVNLGLHILTGRFVAIKSFNKTKLESVSAINKIYHEVNLMKNLRHNSIVKILETIETDKYILIVMENVSGGDLLSFVKKRSQLSEKTAKMIFRQLMLALKYIHSRNIIHRDIKLDNILIDLNNNIKLCDFGVGKQIHKGELLNDQCGTPAYIAPEIVRNEGYEGPPVDLWSSGVVLYAMLSGTFPFKATNIKELNRIIQQGHCRTIDKISPEAKSLLSGLLESDPKKRFTIEKVLNHPWLNSGYISEEYKYSLFTNAEVILLSKANVDYRTCDKEEMIENFTISNLNTENVTNNKNITTRSLIFAPFNSSVEYKNSEENEIKIENSVIKFSDMAKVLNRNYELNNNGEIDHGMLIMQKSHNKKEKEPVITQIEKENSINTINNDDDFNLDDKLSQPVSPMSEKKKKVDIEFSSFKNSQRNFTSLTNSSTQLIDEAVLKTLENFGYNRDYMQKSLTNNELNYGTASYFLLTNFNDFSY